ncbi:MAG: cyclic nucleotide-binding protein, partial [Planctomycetes bacterium]|nr:cyclic nucleotide-binding protein [Planctomycetota bacterium]
VIPWTNSVVDAISRDKLETKLRDDTAFAARFYRALGVFLAHRLRRMTLQGAKERDSGAHPADETTDDELDPQLLESISLAGKRFEWFQSRFGVA